MKLFDNITTRPKTFAPFVYVDFAFGLASGILEAFHQYGWVRAVLIVGIPPNLYFAAPAFFFPNFVARRTGFRPGSETVWLRNAGLLIWIITAAHVLAAIHPQQWSEVVWLTVGGRLSAGVYWVIVATSKPVSKAFPTGDRLGAMAAPRVLVLGGGFTALHFCRAARRAINAGKLDVTVVSRDNFLCIHGMINEMVVGRIAPGTIANPARRIFAPAKFHQGEIESIDVDAKTVTVSRAIDGARSVLEYDVLVLGLGTAENVEVYPGLAEHAFKLKSFHDCFRLRNHILEMLELAEHEPDEEERRRLLTFFVAGGGYSGTEIAGELADFMTKMTDTVYPRINRDECRVVVVHPGPTLLPELYGSTVERKVRAHPRLIKHAEKHALALGVELFLETRIEAATPTEVFLSNGVSIPTRTIISSVGTKPNPLIADLPFERDTRGRLITDEFLRVQGRTDVWAGGDCGASRHPKGGTTPPNAFYGLKTGRHIGKQVRRTAAGKSPRRYRSQVRIEGINLGGRRAVGQLNGIWTYGYFPWISFRIGAIYLAASLDRRMHLVADWTVAMLVGRDIVQMSGPGGPGYEVAENFFEPGQHIADRQRLFRYVHVVVEGEVDLMKRVDGREESVSMVGSGGYFGRKALDRAGADLVRARTVVRTLAIHVDQASKLQDILRSAPMMETRTGLFTIPTETPPS